MPTAVGADGKHVRQPRSAAELDRIATLVKTAIGFDEKRGDQVDVVSMHFADDEPLRREPSGLFGFRLEKADVMHLAQTGLFGLVALLALLFVLRPMVTRLITLAPGGGMGSLPAAARRPRSPVRARTALLAGSPARRRCAPACAGDPAAGGRKHGESGADRGPDPRLVAAPRHRAGGQASGRDPVHRARLDGAGMADVAKSDDYRGLTGGQKAAMLMLALGEDQCARLFGMMHEDELKDISAAMAELGSVRAEVVERLCLDFAENMGSAGNLVGSFRAPIACGKGAPARSCRAIMEEIRGPAGRTMWDKLGNVNESVLANYLKNEYPQTVAVVLSKVRPEHAARVLAFAAGFFAMEVVMRMLRMESVQKDVLDGVEKTLRAEFMSNLARSTRRDAHEMMAEIFNNLDRQSEGRFIAALEERNREAAERIKSLMFTFDDLARLTRNRCSCCCARSRRTSCRWR